ncbi:MAG: molybdopterin-binding protein, partial [Candidatus Hodarchaeota archaeon]
VARQAYLPEGADPIKPLQGTAPGIIIRFEKKLIFVLPGAPSEMKQMFDETVVPLLQKESPLKTAIRTRIIRTCGEGELAIEEKIREIWYEIASFDVKTNVESLTNDLPPEINEKSDKCETLDTGKVENHCLKCNKSFNESPYEHTIQEHFYELFNIQLNDLLEGIYSLDQ